MSMTKKDYELIASQINGSRFYRNEQYIVTEFLVNRLANVFKADNPKFDRDKFLEACGIKE